jgi:hypothetical protein
VPQHFEAQWQANRAAFPRGIDLILAAPGCVAALPRSTRLVRAGGLSHVCSSQGRRSRHCQCPPPARGPAARRPPCPALTLEQIAGQLSLAVDRVMGEGSLYDPELAALAIKQARGDLIEAVFLLRAYRTTLPRFGHSEPVDTGEMLVERRVSAIYKDLPGGQLLGPTFDYTHRLLDPDLAGDEPSMRPRPGRIAASGSCAFPTFWRTRG